MLGPQAVWYAARRPFFAPPWRASTHGQQTPECGFAKSRCRGLGEPAGQRAAGPQLSALPNAGWVCEIER